MLRVSLNGGEVSAKMQGRVDLPVYQSSAVECKNFVVDIEGGIRRRSGFEFCGFAKRDDGVVRVFPFRYSVADQLVLEVGRGYIRFWRGNELVLRSDGSVYELESPWLDDVVLEGLRIEQVNDVMWFVSPEAPPVVLERFGELDWRLRVIEFKSAPMSASLATNGVGWSVNGYGFDRVILNDRRSELANLGLAVSDSMSISLSRDELRYPDLGVGVRRCALKPSPYGGVLGDLTGKLSTRPAVVGWTFYQLVDGWYRYYTCTKQWQASYATLGQDARAYPEYFMSGIIGGVPEFSILTKRSLIIDTNTNFAKRVTYKAGSWALVYAGQSIDSIYNYYIYFKRDFKMWPNKDGGDVVWTYGHEDKDWSWVGDQINYPDTWQRVDAGVRLDLPFYVMGPWSVTSEGSWDAEWEIRRSYDVGLNPVLNPDLNLSVFGRAGYYHRSWDAVRNFSQGVAGERKNVDISLVEDELCLIGVFLVRSKALTAASMGVVNFSYDESSEVVDCRVSSIADDGTIKLETTREMYDLATSGLSRDVKMGEFCSARGYPRAVVIHQGRLWFGGTKGAPTGLWGSASDDFYNFRAGSNDGDAVSVSLNSGEQSAVAWLSSARHLLVGSEGAEWVVSGGQDGVIKPSTIEARIQSRVGSLGGHVCDTYAGVCYVGRNGRQMWNMAYSWEAESWTSRNLTKYASHLFADSSARKIEFMKGACDLIWVLSGGGLASCSLSADDGVQAWAQHSLGAAARVGDICVSGDTAGESVLNVVARLGESSRVCILRWKDEGGHFCDFWSEASGAAVLPPAEYVSRYKTSRFELPDDASSRRGAVMLRLDVDRSYADGVKVGVGNILKPFSYTVGKVFDGWCESGVSGHWENGLSVEIEACGEHGFSLRGIMLLVQ